MSNLIKDVKPIAEQLLALTVDLLRIVDEDNTQREDFLLNLKKMPPRKC